MKYIVVTGDSGGLGQEIVRQILADEEYGVIGLSRRFTDEIENMQNIYAGRYEHIDFDLSKPELVKDLYKERLRKYKHIYGLVNNAANAYDDIVTNAQPEKLQVMFAVNVFSPIMLSKYVIRDMLVTGIKGAMVHISSVSTKTGYKGLSMYAATKGALEAFSLGVAREWGAMGIRSNVVAPGFMETNISAKLTSLQREKIYKRTSLKKATDLASVAAAVVSLLGDSMNSVTGALFRIDNGT